MNEQNLNIVTLENLESMLDMDEKVALLFDGISCYESARALDIEIDYKVLLSSFQQCCRVLRANYYTSVPSSDEYNSLKPLIDFLDYNGYNVVSRSVRDINDNHKRRAYVEVDMIVDAMQLIPYCDHYVLFTGNGIFISLVNALRAAGKRITLISTLATESPTVSDELRRKVDIFLEMNNIVGLIGRKRTTD